MVDVSALYAAENLEDGLAVLLKPMPHWLPLTSALTATALYYGSYRFRLLLSKVRHLQRYRIAKRQAEEDMALHAATQQSLAELDNNNSSSSSIARSPNGDPTEVSDLDVREFCMSLGILLPRDDDLQLRIEQMIHGDPIPEGFALVRTSGGYIRYQNQQTEELTFFYSAELRREICETVKQRNEADYKTFFVDGDEQRFTSRNNATAAAVTGGSSSLFSSWRQQPTTTTTASSEDDAKRGEPEPKSLRKIDWNEVDEQETAAGGAGEKSVGWQAFHDVLNYFVAREKAKIEAEAQQQQLRSQQATTSNSSNEPTPSNSAVKRSTITKRARVSISYAPKQPTFFDSRSAAPPVPASLPPVAPKAAATASAPPTAAASAAVLPPSAGSHDEDSVVLTPSAPPTTASGAPAPRRPSLGDGSEPQQQQQHYTPAGLPPVPKRVPTPRSSRQNSPMEGGGSSSLRRTDSNLSNSGTQPRTPTWRAKSPTQGSLPPPHVTL